MRKRSEAENNKDEKEDKTLKHKKKNTDLVGVLRGSFCYKSGGFGIFLIENHLASEVTAKHIYVFCVFCSLSASPVDMVRGLLGKPPPPPDPTLESTSPSPHQGSIWHRFNIDFDIDSTSISRFGPKSMSNQCKIDAKSTPDEGRARFSLIFADSRLFLENKAFGKRRFSQKTADFRRKPQKTAGTRRKPQIGICPLRFVPLSAALNTPVSQLIW